MGYRLSESEYRLLSALKGKIRAGVWYSSDEIAHLAGIDRSSVEALLRLLADKGIVELREEETKQVSITDVGKRYLAEGFPEEKLVSFLLERGGKVEINEVAKHLGEELSIAIAHATRKGWIRIDKGVVMLNKKPETIEERTTLEKLTRGEPVSEEDLRLLRRRRLVEIMTKTRTLVRFRSDPSSIVEHVVIEIGSLTRDHIVSGLWRRAVLREYNVAAEPPRLYPGRTHFFVDFIEYIRDIMKEMGFVEIEYTPVELEYWNYDALFQPQHHPARSPTDTFYLDTPREGRVADELLVRAKNVHEKAWGYPWDPKRALRLILRSHTTAVSARILATKPKPPFRFFTIGRVYRVEKVDPRHLPEFHQLDGIAADYTISFADLIGLLAEFFERIGVKDFKVRLTYFPFTEPSAEIYLRLGNQWLEVLGCGMFRPEVLEILGVDYPVAAWGMGLERIAMAIYGLEDIRQLYSLDITFLRNIKTRWWIRAGLEI